MPLIPEDILDQIQARVDIAELIGRYVPLKRAGRHFKALCPFHTERTPSFHINTEKQIYHCFGCGAGGNLFSFLMQQERLTFPEAVRQLAEHVGVAIPERAQASRNGKTEELFTILEKACRYYERMLAHPTWGRVAREYLRTRGVNERTRSTFRLGCAPRGGEHLIQAAKKTPIALDLLERAGLVLQSSRGLVDRFRQRLLFPIEDARGRVIGFGGRSLEGQEPKYLNSPETAVYTKGRHLFGLSKAKEAIVKAKMAIVVEGYFDCVLLWQAGFTHVVSPLGTAFTPEQAKLLARYTDRVVLAFDADAAGETAALRGIDVLVETGLQVQVAQLPAGIDPDECVRSYGAGAFQDIVTKAVGVLEFLLACATARFPLSDTEQRVRAAQWILPTVANVPNVMLRTEYVRLLAERLRLDEHAVIQELGKVKPRSIRDAQRVAPPAPARRTEGRGVERLFTGLILDDPSRLDAITPEALFEQITDSGLRGVLRVIHESRASTHADPTPAQVISRLGDDEAVRLVSELVHLAQAEPSKDDAFRQCLRRLQQEARARERDQLRDQLRVAQQLGCEEDVTRLLKSLQRLVKHPVPAEKGE